MIHRPLGRNGLKVSSLCLGAMMFGDQTGEAEALEIIASARDAGVNFIDTADAYSAGVSEQIVGRTIHDDRDRWVVATKVGYPAGLTAPNGADLSRGYLMRAAERSLKNLGTGHIGRISRG